MTVRREDLERNIAKVLASVDDPRGGVYGSRSISWQVGREAMLFLGAGSAALLQLAHPFVAHAIDKQSRTESDPLGRFVGTFHYVYRILFGHLDEAIGSARRVFRIHERVNGEVDENVGMYAAGSRYDALDEEALYWVHATLEHSSIDVFERVIRPLSLAEKDRYNHEAMNGAALFGVPFERLPTSWTAFDAEFVRLTLSERIAVGKPAREIAHALLHPVPPNLHAFARWYRIITAGLLPSHLREAYGLPFGDREARIFSRSIEAARIARRMSLDALSFVPAYHDAMWRVRGKTGRAPIANLLERALFKGAKMANLSSTISRRATSS